MAKQNWWAPLSPLYVCVCIYMCMCVYIYVYSALMLHISNQIFSYIFPNRTVNVGSRYTFVLQILAPSPVPFCWSRINSWVRFLFWCDSPLFNFDCGDVHGQPIETPMCVVCYHSRTTNCSIELYTALFTMNSDTRNHNLSGLKQKTNVKNNIVIDNCSSISLEHYIVGQ